MKKSVGITLLFFALAVYSQETKQPQSFSLNESIEFALKNNYAAINAGRDINSAREKKWETTAMGLPQINASVDYQNFLKQPISLADFNQDGINEQFVFGTKQNLNARITLSQLIFDGSYIVALQASKTYLKFFENAKQKTNNEIKEMTINAYGNVLLAEESILILKKNKAILEKTLFETKETLKNGLIEEESVEQLQITLTTINSSLNNTIRLREIALNYFKIILGIDLKETVLLTDKLEVLAKSNLDGSFSKSEFNLNQNVDYQIGLNFQDQKRLEMLQQKSTALPSLSAFVNYGTTGNNDRFRFFGSEQQWFNSSLLGVSLNVPIFSSLARSSRTQQAKIAYEKAKTNLTETEQKLKLQYENAKSQYEFSIEQYATSQNNLNLADRIERKQQIKFTEGLSSSFEFSEAQRQLYAAQQNYLQSMVDVITKKAALEKIVTSN